MKKERVGEEWRVRKKWKQYNLHLPAISSNVLPPFKQALIN